MQDVVRALVEALADAAASEEALASQLAELGREACELSCPEFQAAFLRVARAHRAAAIRHRAQHAAILHQHGVAPTGDVEADLT